MNISKTSNLRSSEQLKSDLTISVPHNGCFKVVTSEISVDNRVVCVSKLPDLVSPFLPLGGSEINYLLQMGRNELPAFVGTVA